MSMRVDEKNFTAATFVSLGEKCKLGDIKADNTNWGNSYIMFLDKDGATEKIVDENLGNVDKAFYFVNSAEADEWGCDIGWYLMADEETLYPYNDMEVKFGQGYEFVCQDIGASLTYAGSVAEGTTDLPMNVDEKNFTAFIVPRAGTMGDMIAKNTNWGNSYIMFLDKDGATEKIVDENLGNVDKAFYYVNPDEATEWGCDVGWYLMADEETLYPYNDMPLAAGEGFEFVCQDVGAILQMPAAIPAKE